MTILTTAITFAILAVLGIVGGSALAIIDNASRSAVPDDWVRAMERGWTRAELEREDTPAG